METTNIQPANCPLQGWVSLLDLLFGRHWDNCSVWSANTEMKRLFRTKMLRRSCKHIVTAWIHMLSAKESPNMRFFVFHDCNFRREAWWSKHPWIFVSLGVPGTRRHQLVEVGRCGIRLVHAWLKLTWPSLAKLHWLQPTGANSLMICSGLKMVILSIFTNIRSFFEGLEGLNQKQGTVWVVRIRTMSSGNKQFNPSSHVM